MANKEIYPDGIINQTEEFALRQKVKKIVHDNVEDIIKEETIKAFEKIGYEENDGYMFVIASNGKDGKEKEVGKGTSEGKLTVTVSVPKMLNMGAAKPISYMQKTTTFGGKKLVSEIYIDVQGKSANIDYRNTEAASFHYSSTKNTYTNNPLNKSGSISGIDKEDKFKKDFRNFFVSIAEAESLYLTSTKIANDDKIEKDMNDSIIKENKYSMKISDIVSNSYEDVDKKIKQMIHESTLSTKEKKEEDKVGTPKTPSGKPTDKDLVIGNESKEETVDEITASGGGAAGGSYLTPHAFTNDGKTKAFNTNKNLGYTQVQMSESVKNTTYGAMRSHRPYLERQEDGSYKIITESDLKTPYTQVVPMGKDGWPPKGMEHNFALGKHGIEVNSSEELKETGHGDLNKIVKESLINETGEWDDSDPDMKSWKEYLKTEIEEIASMFPDEMQVLNVKGFDKYQGPYANVSIGGEIFEVWTIGEESLWIDDFPIDNTSEEGFRPGFAGTKHEIVEAIKKYLNGLNESLKKSLVKRKFVSSIENEEKGINKRYIITETFTKEEQANRWKELYTNECFCKIKDVSRKEYEQERSQEFSNNPIESDMQNTVYSGNEEGFVDVPKAKGSMVVFRLSESDLKKNKMYIIDHFTKKLVLNPLFKTSI